MVRIHVSIDDIEGFSVQLNTILYVNWSWRNVGYEQKYGVRLFFFT